MKIRFRLQFRSRSCNTSMSKQLISLHFRSVQCREFQAKTQAVFQAKSQAKTFLLNSLPALLLALPVVDLLVDVVHLAQRPLLEVTLRVQVAGQLAPALEGVPAVPAPVASSASRSTLDYMYFKVIKNRQGDTHP